MLSDIDLGDGISIKLCRSDLGLEVALYKAKFGQQHSFDLEENTVKLPVDIIGFNAKPNKWIVLKLIEAPEFLIASKGDLLAVRRTNKVRSGQIAIIKHEEKFLIKRLFPIGEGLALRALDDKADLLVLPSALDIRGTIEGLAIEGVWYKIITNEKLPHH
jgi:hypothetical protein